MHIRKKAAAYTVRGCANNCAFLGIHAEKPGISEADI
jgi:hypothetical protein